MDEVPTEADWRGGMTMAEDVARKGQGLHRNTNLTTPISHNVLVKWFQKASSPSKPSTNCLLSVKVNHKLTILWGDST